MVSVHKSPPLVPILSPINPVQLLRSILILFSQAVTFLQVSPSNLVCISLFPHACHMPHLHLLWFYHPNNIWWGVQIMKHLTAIFKVCSRISTFYASVYRRCTSYSIYFQRSHMWFGVQKTTIPFPFLSGFRHCSIKLYYSRDVIVGLEQGPKNELLPFCHNHELSWLSSLV
jgi:hypothetical protein